MTLKGYVNSHLHPVGQGFIAEITLNRPKALNALSSEMFKELQRLLFSFKEREDIYFLFFHSSSTRAFGSGGDVKMVGQELFKDKESKAIEEFFKLEYKTDYLLQTYNKPIVAWGDGLLMGGGLGVFNGVSHRVVTPSTLLAMPEVAIGFFPDVGAGYFLNKKYKELGLFLGLTGARFGADDALDLDLADYKIEGTKKDEVFSKLLSETWDIGEEAIREKLSGLLISYVLNPHGNKEKCGQLLKCEDEIKIKLQSNDWKEVCEKLLSWKNSGNNWIEQSLGYFKKGSPLSWALSFRYLKEASTKNVKDVLLDDLNFAFQFCRGEDFREGVRALLLDKDQKPNWGFKTIDKIENADLDPYFESIINRELMDDYFSSEDLLDQNHHHQVFQSKGFPQV